MVTLREVLGILIIKKNNCFVGENYRKSFTERIPKNSERFSIEIVRNNRYNYAKME